MEAHSKWNIVVENCQPAAHGRRWRCRENCTRLEVMRPNPTPYCEPDLYSGPQALIACAMSAAAQRNIHCTCTQLMTPRSRYN